VPDDQPGQPHQEPDQLDEGDDPAEGAVDRCPPGGDRERVGVGELRDLLTGHDLAPVLLIIGLLQTYRFLSQNHAHPLTFAALGGSLVLAAIFGALRARTVRVWLDDGQAWSQGNWLTAVLWIASLAAHLGYDILVGHGNGIRGLGVATIVLYLAISLGFQRVLVMQRAHRLQLAGPAAVAEPGGTG